MKKKGLLVALMALVIAGATYGATLAFFNDKADATNTFTMGKVDIDLEEPLFSEEHENNTITNVKPGDSIVKDPKITIAKDSSDAYIRAKIVFEGVDEKDIAALEAGIEFNDGWSKGTDGKYYYDQALKAGDARYVFEKVNVPTSWDNETITSGQFKIIVQAEAVQKDNIRIQKNADGSIVGWVDAAGNTIDLVD